MNFFENKYLGRRYTASDGSDWSDLFQTDAMLDRIFRDFEHGLEYMVADILMYGVAVNEAENGSFYEDAFIDTALDIVTDRSIDFDKFKAVRNYAIFYIVNAFFIHASEYTKLGYHILYSEETVNLNLLEKFIMEILERIDRDPGFVLDVRVFDEQYDDIPGNCKRIEVRYNHSLLEVILALEEKLCMFHAFKMFFVIN